MQAGCVTNTASTESGSPQSLFELKLCGKAVAATTAAAAAICCLQHIWHPIISQLLQGSTQLAPATRICGLASTWRRYDELTDLPEGLVILADSLCSFNPAYGQGMTIAAMEVAVLDKLLTQHAATRVSAAAAAANTRGSDATRAGNSSTSCQCEAVTSDEPGWLRGLGKETLKAVQPIVSGAWLLAVGNDMRFPSAVSNQARTRGLMGRAEAAAQVYMHTLLKMAPTDNWVSGDESA